MLQIEFTINTAHYRLVKLDLSWKSLGQQYNNKKLNLRLLACSKVMPLFAVYKTNVQE